MVEELINRISTAAAANQRQAESHDANELHRTNDLDETSHGFNPPARLSLVIDPLESGQVPKRAILLLTCTASNMTSTRHHIVQIENMVFSGFISHLMLVMILYRMGL